MVGRGDLSSFEQLNLEEVLFFAVFGTKRVEVGFEEVRNRATNGEVEVLCKLMREGLDEKLDLWLEIGHFHRAKGSLKGAAE